jgi:hypothetical protein
MNSNKLWFVIGAGLLTYNVFMSVKASRKIERLRKKLEDPIISEEERAAAEAEIQRCWRYL